MPTDHQLIADQIDRYHSMIENYPDLLDTEFDQDLLDLQSEIDELRDLLNH